jgi:DIS3-like exonuclease 2
LGDALTLEHEIQALLISYAVDHGDYPPQALKHVDETVQSGIFYNESELQWRPTPEMLEGRRDYRGERIFTIDPTTAKDLDDALHIKLLEGDGNGRGIVEVGVHIADVSYFVTPGSPVDDEAQRRTTTVYLVDRTIPMLPRPLCEMACSLNENVERLAFSCVWKMYLDGTLVPGANNVWYGRTVIKSCARLDYSTAQNIIDNKVATGEACLDAELWPTHRRPTEPHTIDQVAADVRLMHRVAMARRRIRFENGALALHGTKLTFQLDTDGQTPLLVAPYPIRDSNRLVEEYMLLANYLVAQRLIMHARRLAVLRMHPEPLMEGLDSVVNVAAAAGVTIDIETAQTLHQSLVRLARQGDPLLLQCVTNLLMTPMQAAEYFVTGCRENPEEWKHYALNIPYYTHFTSPIRRYPDVLVHRLLQATIDGPSAVAGFPVDAETLEELCVHSNEKRLASKNAQERCDRVFLSLFVRKHPLESQLGIVLSVGQSIFTVFLPGLGTSAMLYLLEHKSMLTYASDETNGDKRRILLQRRPGKGKAEWSTLEIEVLVKVSVTVVFKDKPPIDIKARLEGPWKG